MYSSSSSSKSDRVHVEDSPALLCPDPSDSSSSFRVLEIAQHRFPQPQKAYADSGKKLAEVVKVQFLAC